MIFECNGVFKIGTLVCRTGGPDRTKGVVNYGNYNTEWVILQENLRRTTKKMAASTNISKLSLFRILHNNL